MTLLFLIIAIGVLMAAALIWVFIDPGYAMKKGIAVPTLQGRIQLRMLRLSVPLITGVNKSIGLTKYPMGEIAPIMVPTKYGSAKVTIYRPPETVSRKLPLYINHHGGGFVVGYAEQDDMICRYLSKHVNCVVANVDYILAPEHSYPAPILQCYQVAEWLKAYAEELNIDAERIAVGGQSAGATIAASLCLKALEKGKSMFCQQILNYGYFETNEDPTEKFIEKGKSQALGPKMLSLFQNLYLPNVMDRREPLASPLLANNLDGVPGALIITAEHDLMKMDGNRYAEKLKQNGVCVIHREYKDADHGFIVNGPNQPALAAIKLMVETLTDAFD